MTRLPINNVKSKKNYQTIYKGYDILYNLSIIFSSQKGGSTKGTLDLHGINE